ncbi:hypothetical protein QX776_08450 [Alteromonadaceae bacterium BrNp21-10]|nr:hypothetical protein [Alteromonadaceae bacterium BrNp21-10]
MPLFRYICFSLVVVIGFGCSSIPLRTMYHMSQANPLETPPESIKVAVRADKGIKIQKGSVEFKLGYTAEDNSLIIEDIYLVEVQNDNRQYPRLLDDAQPDEVVTLLKLSDADAKQMRESQRLIGQHKANGGEGKGMISIQLTRTCIVNEVPKNLSFDMFMQLDPEVGFLTFFEDMDIRDNDDAKLGDINQWPKCAD